MRGTLGWTSAMLVATGAVTTVRAQDRGDLAVNVAAIAYGVFAVGVAVRAVEHYSDAGVPAAVGSRIRGLRATPLGSRPVAGTVLEMRADSLVLSNESGRVTVPRSELTDVEVYDGMERRWARGWVAGTATGAVLGLLLGSFAQGLSDEQSCDTKCYEGYGLVISLGALAVGPPGALIGSAFHGERWRPARNLPEAHMSVLPTLDTHGRIGLAARLEF